MRACGDMQAEGDISMGHLREHVEYKYEYKYICKCKFKCRMQNTDAKYRCKFVMKIHKQKQIHVYFTNLPFLTNTKYTNKKQIQVYFADYTFADTYRKQNTHAKYKIQIQTCSTT